MKVAAALSLLVAVQLAHVHLAEAQFESEVDEMAPYEIIKKGQDYEERYYPPARWVCHSKTSMRPTMSRMSQSFFPLFSYITGANDRGSKIQMTAPVTTMMRQEPATSSWWSQMCFYLPEAHQADTPNPENPEVYLEDRPAMIVFTRTTGGFLTKAAQWKYQATLLKESLLNAKEPADFSTYYMAGYDSPMKFLNRRNEIWYMKKM
ncbi:heme-binding protein 2-like [Scylla paramamosain]|uniref:heme-binding protein 2-like n=1 Tax=Scylla paramamosain TaxID=85552 RepID=UPI003082F9C4